MQTSLLTATPRRALTVVLATLLALTVLAPGALAATGRASSGTTPVAAEERTALELAAEGYAIKAHNDQRRAADPTVRNGDQHTDVDGGQTMQPWTDIMTVSRRWSDHMAYDNFYHNPDYARQYGHWSRAAENIAVATIKPVALGHPTRAEVLARTESLMQAWWNSTGHRVNWMRDGWDHFAVGASVQTETITFPSGSHDYWVLTLTANFRQHDGSDIAGTSFPADGSDPLNETDPIDTGGSTGASSGRSTAASTGARFADVPTGHVFADPIAQLADSGVTRGCGGDRFCPDDDVTRGQMAAFLTRALDLPDGNRSFADTRGHLFASPVAALARAGITTGCNPGGGNTRFCPDDAVTRGQMAAFLTRALDLPDGNGSFADTRGHVFEAPIAALARAGITAGCNPAGGNTRFCPDEPVTRAQMAAFLARAGVLD